MTQVRGRKSSTLVPSALRREITGLGGHVDVWRRCMEDVLFVFGVAVNLVGSLVMDRPIRRRGRWSIHRALVDRPTLRREIGGLGWFGGRRRCRQIGRELPRGGGTLDPIEGMFAGDGGRGWRWNRCIHRKGRRGRRILRKFAPCGEFLVFDSVPRPFPRSPEGFVRKQSSHPGQPDPTAGSADLADEAGRIDGTVAREHPDLGGGKRRPDRSIRHTDLVALLGHGEAAS